MIPPAARLLLCSAALLLGHAAAMAQGEEGQPFDFEFVVTGAFWQQLYPAGGWTLLCGEHFGAGQRLQDGRSVSIDHLVPVTAMVKALGCRDRAQCLARIGEKFARMESDLHNLYPEPQELITYRINRAYGVVAGENWRYDTCDVEWQNGILEPRPLARGNIARAILYMRATYKFPVSDAMLELLKEWNRADPPSNQELERNSVIERIQGQRNSFIDNPALVENLRNIRN
ncbi:MAG: endonuclease [Gammaproteobacteria bacterium]|nr:endonuclease [Gammaproteobacteria bacterium]